MGVPDFVKFIARSSPGALCRLPKSDTTEPLLFDFILIDATNAAQTLGLEALLAFLSPDRILARSAVIFAIDSQRDRSGTSRSQRHTLVRIGDLDVQVSKLCSQLADQYREHGARHRGSATHVTTAPQILTSGRGVAGEADYKLLDLQRKLLTSALAAGTAQLPTFLFISEDSDVLCGALCGPAAQQVSIATRLQDVLYEPSILRLDRVLAFIATCTDAFYAEKEREAAAAAAAKLKAAEERNAAARAKQAAAAHTKEDAVVEQEQQEDEEEEVVELSVEDRAVAAAPQNAPAAEEGDVVRRRKQDGPMVATGVRIELTDSSDDDDDEGPAEKPVTSKSTEAVAAAAGKKREREGETASTSATVAASAAAAAVVSDPTPTANELTASTIAFTSSVDMVFLFMLVMGNGANVPSLVRGATKVDAGSCWQAYCKHKYKALAATESEMGRMLLSSSVSTHATNRGSFVLNCRFLHAIFDALHYADAEARPPGEEEKQRAIAYLSNAVYSMLRYVVGCNLEKPPVLQQTFLDSRNLAEMTVTLPSLSAVMWVLGQEATRTFTFPLYGLPKKDLLAVAAGGTVAHSSPAAASSSSAAAAQRDASMSPGELDVGEHLVAPIAANAWAVRGARTNTVSLTALVHSFTSRGSASAAGSRAATGVALRAVPLPSMTDLLKQCLQRSLPDVLAKANVLVYLVNVWEYALGMGVRRLFALTKGAANVARAEGGEQTFAAAQTASVPANGAKSAHVNAASRGKQAAGHYVYSFELRRMAPVMHASDTATGTTQPPTASAVKGTGATTEGPASAGAGGSKSAAQLAVLAALGVSYDYSQAPSAPANVVHLPSSALDDEDRAELQRLRKVAKKERALVASAAANEEGTAEPAGVEKRAVPGRSKEQPKKEKAKGKKRLGKRERMQLQKSMAKAGATNSATAVLGKASEAKKSVAKK